jgi:hypothetical protein
MKWVELVRQLLLIKFFDRKDLTEAGSYLCNVYYVLDILSALHL